MLRASLALAMVAVTVITLGACSSSGSGLTGKDWQLTAITEKVPAFQGVVPPADQSKYTITFGSDGTFSAKADCNQVAGSYTTSGSDGLTITPGPGTLAFCGEASMDTQYVEALSKAASYSIASGQLTITLSDEGTLQYQ